MHGAVDARDDHIPRWRGGAKRGVAIRMDGSDQEVERDLKKDMSELLGGLPRSAPRNHISPKPKNSSSEKPSGRMRVALLEACRVNHDPGCEGVHSQTQPTPGAPQGTGIKPNPARDQETLDVVDSQSVVLL